MFTQVLNYTLERSKEHEKQMKKTEVEIYASLVLDKEKLQGVCSAESLG